MQQMLQLFLGKKCKAKLCEKVTIHTFLNEGIRMKPQGSSAELLHCCQHLQFLSLSVVGQELSGTKHVFWERRWEIIGKGNYEGGAVWLHKNLQYTAACLCSQGLTGEKS